MDPDDPHHRRPPDDAENDSGARSSGSGGDGQRGTSSHGAGSHRAGPHGAGSNAGGTYGAELHGAEPHDAEPHGAGTHRPGLTGADVAVLRGRSKRAVRDGALVLQAAGIPHAVMADGAGATLWVALRDEQRALTELSSYRRENVGWPPLRADAPPLLTSGVEGAVTYVLLVVLMFWLERRVFLGIDWDRIGVLHAGSVRAGEFWRPWTALTMHVDATHLISNIVFGGLFTILAAQALGSGVAWLGTVLAGALGNGLEVWLVEPDHRGVGASTAIFGTLGLMTAAEWVRRGTGPTPWVRRVAPLFGGAVLFGWLGGGGGSDRVDVLAHALGFAFGALLGVAVARLHLAQRLGRRGQRALAVLALLLIVGAWAAGIVAYPPTRE